MAFATEGSRLAPCVNFQLRNPDSVKLSGKEMAVRLSNPLFIPGSSG